MLARQPFMGEEENVANVGFAEIEQFVATACKTDQGGPEGRLFDELQSILV